MHLRTVISMFAGCDVASPCWNTGTA